MELVLEQIAPTQKLERNFFYQTSNNIVNVTYDTQGNYWNSEDRDRSLNTRLRNHQGFRNVSPISSIEISQRRDFHQKKKTDICYQFKKFYSKIPIKITHFQVRKNFYLSPCGSEIIYSKKFGIESFNLIKHKQQTLSALSMEDENNPDKSMICFDITKNLDGDYIICIGRSDGTVNLYKITRDELEKLKNLKFNKTPNYENYLTKVISQGEASDILTNYVRFISDKGNDSEKNLLLTTNNDGHVRIFDLRNDMKQIKDFKGDAPINHCDFNFTGNVLACIGDSTNIELFDANTCNRINKFIAHYDYGTVVKFKPNDEYVCASGNQDFSAKIWDIRYLDKISKYDSSIFKSTKNLFGHFDSIGDLLFINANKIFNEDLLVYAENADYIHIYNMQSDSVQTLSYLGYFAGMAYNPNNSNLLVGVEDYNLGGVLCYDGIKAINSLNKLFI
jgi:WD40 repeat protein